MKLRKLMSFGIIVIFCMGLISAGNVSATETNDHWETFLAHYTTPQYIDSSDGSLVYGALGDYPFQVTVHYDAIFYSESDPWIKIKITEIDVSAAAYYGWAGSEGDTFAMYVTFDIVYIDNNDNLIAEEIIGHEPIGVRVVDEYDYSNQYNWYFNNVYDGDHTTSSKLDKDVSFEIRAYISHTSSHNGGLAVYQIDQWYFEQSIEDPDYWDEVRVMPNNQVKLFDHSSSSYNDAGWRYYIMDIPPYPSSGGGGGGGGWQ